MNELKKYDIYPWWIILISNSLSLSIYVFGFVIMIHLGLTVSLLYLTGILLFEYRMLRYHCVNCFYWGKACGFGKGKVSSWFFKKGSPSKFCQNNFTWKDLIPDMMITLVPLATGMILLILEFNFIIIFSMILIILLTTTGNGFVRGKLTCSFCKQKELGCPADKLFNKTK